MNCSLEKHTIEYLEEVNLIDHVKKLQELVRQVMLALNKGEYLDCAGVVEANFKIISKQVHEVMKKDKKLSVEEAIKIVKDSFS